MFAASKTDQNVAGGPPPSGDPYWTSVSLLTNFENNLTFQDGSTNNFAITRNGVVNPSLNTPFTGGVGGSEYFSGSQSNYLTAPNNAAFAFGSGNFTVECWYYATSLPAATVLLSKWNAGGAAGSNQWLLYLVNKTPNFSASVDGTNIALTATSTAITTNTWNHIAIVRNGNNFNLYTNGVSGTTLTNAGALYALETEVLGIGYRRNNGFVFEPLFGFLSNARIVKGTAVYTANFTPPTAPLTAITNTSLLITGTGQGMFNNATFVDQGPNALTVTATGAPVYSGRSPFGNTYAGSVLLGGNPIYLSVPQSTGFEFGSGNFTVEAWVNFNTVPTTASNYSCIIESDNIAVTRGWLMLADGDNSGKLAFTAFSGATAYSVLSATAPAINTWYHVAAVRNGGTLTLYVNGTAVSTNTTLSTASINIVSGTNFIGALKQSGNPVANGYFNGYISNLRIVKGTAVYTANFTPPTTPLTAITNTSLLVRGDTGAFYDLSNNGNGMTSTGTTEVTTQFKQFGSESAVYTSTGRQSVTNATNLQFDSGDYTIEAWVYRPSATLLRTLLSKGGAATGWLLQINSSQQVIFTVTSSIILTSTTTITAGTWTHVAVTRSGTSTRLFVGGNLEATATDSTAFSQTENLSIGVDRSNANGLNGYLDDIRITKGVARYTANFTPPTATFPTGP